MYPKYQVATEPVPPLNHDHHRPPHRTDWDTYLWLLGGNYRRATPVSCESHWIQKQNKNPKVIRGERRFVSASPDPVQGFGNYSSLSHLSLAYTDPVRRPDIPETTVSGVVCPCPLLASGHTRPNTHGTTCPRCETAHKELLCRATTHGIPLSAAILYSLTVRQPPEIPK